MGEMLRETVRHEGGDANTVYQRGTALPKGISRNQSSRFQKAASLPRTWTPKRTDAWARL